MRAVSRAVSKGSRAMRPSLGAITPLWCQARWCSGQVLGFDELTPSLRHSVERVKQSPKDAAAWQDLGVMLEGTDKVPGPDGPVSRLDCLRAAAELGWDDSNVWMHVGASLGEGEVLEVRDTSMTPLGCLLRSVRLNPSNGSAWLNLSFAVQPEQTIALPDIGRLGRLEILAFGAAALEREFGAAVDAQAAADTAAMLAGCYAMGAGALMAGHAAAVPPGAPRERRIAFPAGSGTERTPLQCIERALQVDPDAAMPWVMAGNLMRSNDTVRLASGETASRKAVLEHLLRMDPDNADALAGMAEEIPAEGIATVGDDQLSKMELLGRALRADVACVSAWRQLGFHCAATGAHLPLADGTKLSALECFGRALVYDAGDAALWDAAADEMEKAGVAAITVGSHRLEVSECRQMAKAQRGEGPIPDSLANKTRGA
uniref:Uncharacterized protein n=1 Tax=Neobodo designis TaxID=312471 RepID=A0A7S1PMH4_NEODS|mmetsp:Transcript_10930/g.33823  ORF Transcript_10930/g.33823 Transcript_10930/m.33823 type:complete len:431 (+) Transcript_10930:61-1353(+)